MSSSCLTWTFPVPSAGDRDTRKMPDIVKYRNRAGRAYSLPELMDMDIHTALNACRDLKAVSQRLDVLQKLGLGYLTLGEETPGLSGGEAQRLKLASEMGKTADPVPSSYSTNPPSACIPWMSRRFWTYLRPLSETARP